MFQSDGIFVPGTFYKIHKILGEPFFRECFPGKSSWTNWIGFNGYLEEWDGNLCHLTFLHWDSMSEWSCYIPGNVNSRECKFQGKFGGEMVAMVLSRHLVARCEIELDLCFREICRVKVILLLCLTRDCNLQFSGPISSVLWMQHKGKIEILRWKRNSPKMMKNIVTSDSTLKIWVGENILLWG